MGTAESQYRSSRLEVNPVKILEVGNLSEQNLYPETTDKSPNMFAFWSHTQMGADLATRPKDTKENLKSLNLRFGATVDEYSSPQFHEANEVL